MAELAYRELYRISPQEARRQLVNYYRASGSIRATARAWKTSPREVRRWVRRWQADPNTDFADRSHRPRGSPRQTAPELEARVLALRAQTGYGRQRLARVLRAEGYTLSADTIRHILHRAGVFKPRPKRKAVYPAHWAWEETAPFSLLQTDTKDVRDKGSLGSALVAHLDRQHLPRYQWTACDGVTRLRFLAYSHHLNSTNGLAFLLLVTLWLRAHGIETPLTFQTDWGQEFGGDNPRRVAQLSTRFLAPLGAQLARYPLGRKGYNGRVERSHRTDDEEFYRPCLLAIDSTETYLEMALQWLFFYNVCREHSGVGMQDRTPLQALRDSGYDGPDHIALLPPILLDRISADLLLACDPEVGTDLLTQYTSNRAVSRWLTVAE